MGHFWVHLSLSFKVSLRAKSLLWLLVFIHIEIRTNSHYKNFTLRLLLQERMRGTRKWSTYHGCCVSLNLSHQSTGHGLCQAPRICSISHKNARKKNSPQSNKQKTKKNINIEDLTTHHYSLIKKNNALMPKTTACLYSVSLQNDSNIIQIISLFSKFIRDGTTL